MLMAITSRFRHSPLRHRVEVGWCGLQVVWSAFAAISELEPVIMGFYYASFILFYAMAGLVIWVNSYPKSFA